MAKPKADDLTKYIVPLNMNGLRGRMLRLPAPDKRKREILFIYGHHASLERNIGFAEALNRYGAVTMPDLPGFGGMESYYKIGVQPTIDNLADYLAAFIKMRYKRGRLTIVGMSFGFTVVTKMLQKYPDIAKRIDIVISLVGFTHHEDFHIKRRYFNLFKYVSPLFTFKLPAWVVQHVIYRPALIRLVYWLVANSNEKIKDVDPETRKKLVDFEIGLWRINDVRTYMKTAREMFILNLCDQQVALPVYHVAVDKDRYFNNHLVEQHMRVIYSDYSAMKSKMSGHSHTVIATAKEVAPFIPPKLRAILRRP
jgi:pimeloyl-ACP methyl ester carboxylesterase